MERVLLQEIQHGLPLRSQDQLLVVRQHIAADQLDDLHQAALLGQQGRQSVAVIHKLLSTCSAYQGAKSFKYSE